MFQQWLGIKRFGYNYFGVVLHLAKGHELLVLLKHRFFLQIGAWVNAQQQNIVFLFWFEIQFKAQTNKKLPSFCLVLEVCKEIKHLTLLIYFFSALHIRTGYEMHNCTCTYFSVETNSCILPYFHATLSVLCIYGSDSTQ